MLNKTALRSTAYLVRVKAAIVADVVLTALKAFHMTETRASAA